MKASVISRCFFYSKVHLIFAKFKKKTDIYILINNFFQSIKNFNIVIKYILFIFVVFNKNTK